ncbi:hypothetical protein TIFTF001_023401 [Ficus carica]|uniref:AIPP2-like SPOC-like domain-containing protein n=1 Tax=Ficus carica TaxID=3494 RepID=A0AA88AKE1_FICCA|nr:hypothetical protein TIFTF001_023401 [Ficus carica]
MSQLDLGWLTVFSYCLSVFTLEIPEVWNCESCLSGNDRISTEFAGKEDSLSSSTDMGHSRKLSGPRKVSVLGWKLHSKRQRPVETGKVKFLSQEEVVKLSSGASTKTGSPRKTASAFMSRKTTPTKPKSVNPKFFPERVEKATPPTPSRLMKPGGFNRISMSNQQASRTSKEPKERTPLTSEKRRDPKKRLLEDLVSAEISLNKMDTFTKVFSCAPSSSRPIDPEKKTPTLPRKEHFAEKQPLVNEKQPVDSLIISREVETSNKMTDKEPAETRCTLLPSRHSPLDIRADGDGNDTAEHNHSNAPEEELPNIPSNLYMYLTYLPALQTTWKGGFSIIDSAVSEVLEGFQAQPPCKVHKKAYEISTKMPPILQLKMLPRLHHWADLFEDGGPDLQDIALYFFRADDNMERYTEKYGQLFERMEIQSSIMIGHVNDVELLIFTSNQLNIHSQNILLSKTEKFFCGVFRKPPRGECPELLSPLSCSNPNEASIDDSMNDDMQIDMVGGQSVGILDVVRLKDSSTRGSNEPKTNQASCALLKPKAKPESVAREIDLSPQRPLVKFKLEPRKSLDKSPGFLKKVKPENAFENPSLIGPLKHSQSLVCLWFPGFRDEDDNHMVRVLIKASLWQVDRHCGKKQDMNEIVGDGV